MSKNKLRGKIDFTLFISVRNANPNGDPLNGNRPRTDDLGFGEITAECIKRKIRNRMQDMGHTIFVQSDDRSDDGCKSLKERADHYEKFKKAAGDKKGADKAICRAIACEKWMDVRTFGQTFAFKGSDTVSLGIKGPVTFCKPVSLDPVDVRDIQITKSVNGESKEGMASDRMGMKTIVDFGVYKVVGSICIQLAEETGFSQEDAEVLKEALKTLFENDASSARPEGSMEVCRLYWWQHNEKLPRVSRGRIERAFKIKKVGDNRDFGDYDITWDLDGCVKPEVFDLWS